MVRALIIESDRAESGEVCGYYGNVLSPVPGEFGNIRWSSPQDARYWPYRPVRHKPIFHVPDDYHKMPPYVRALVPVLPNAPKSLGTMRHIKSH